jgi:hypothetical protein
MEAGRDLPHFDDEEMVRLLTDPSATGERLWQESDLAGLLSHQLTSVVWVDMAEVGPAHALRAQELCTRLSPPAVTLNDLLHHPKPDPELLRLVSVLAKTRYHSPAPELPRVLALFLHSAAVLVGRYRCETRIAEHTDAELIENAERLAGVRWVDARTKGLLMRAIEHIRGSNCEPG